MSEIDEFQDLHTVTGVPKLRIIAYLMRSRSDHGCSVKELSEGLDVEQSAVSHHLRWMRHHGLVKHERYKKNSLYKLADPSLAFALLDTSSALAKLNAYAERSDRHG